MGDETMALAHGPARLKRVQLAGRDGPLETDALCIGIYAWHPTLRHAHEPETSPLDPRAYFVCSHLPSGFTIATGLSPRDAELVARAFAHVHPSLDASDKGGLRRAPETRRWALSCEAPSEDEFQALRDDLEDAEEEVANAESRLRDAEDDLDDAVAHRNGIRAEIRRLEERRAAAARATGRVANT